MLLICNQCSNQPDQTHAAKHSRRGDIFGTARELVALQPYSVNGGFDRAIEQLYNQKKYETAN